MNANPMAGMWALVWLALSVYSIASAKPAKWKFLNFLIILAFMGLELGIGAAFGAWGGNMEIGGHIAASLIFLLGIVGAIGCARRNHQREKGAVPGSNKHA